MSHVPSTTGPVYDQRCTTDERALLDAIATTERPPTPDMAAMLAIVDPQQAVIAAAIDETHAEQHLQQRRTSALTAHQPDTADAERRLIDARRARRTAVTNLKTARGR
jgi:hypothetical protein